MNLEKWKLVEYLDIMFPKDAGKFKNKCRSQLLALYLKARKGRSYGV